MEIKKFYRLFTIIFFVLLCAVALIDFPALGDINSLPNKNVSPYYIFNSIKDTHIPNIVTTILADYRGFDTLFETSVILTAGLALILILSKEKFDRSLYVRFSQKTDDVVQTTCRFVMPLMQLFALYVIAHGHYSPGGGFQGGVILGASFIFYAISFGVPKAIERFFKEKRQILAFLGVFIYGGVGALCFLLKGKFLEYSFLSKIFPFDRVMAHSYGVLFIEIGVAITVTIVMFTCYLFLATGNSFDDENLS